MVQVAHVNDLLYGSAPYGSYVVLDTNILIQICDETNYHYARTRSFFHKLKRRKDIRLVYFLASRLELRDYFRKRALTLYLRENFRRDSDLFDGNGELNNHIRDLDKIAGNYKADQILSDYEIKQIRTKCFHNYDTVKKGMERWRQISTIALAETFRGFKKTLADVGIKYKNLYDKDLFPDGAKPPTWDDHEDYVVDFCFGSADASILNMAVSCRKIHAIITNDSDMLEIFRSGKIPTNVHCYTFIGHLLHLAA